MEFVPMYQACGMFGSTDPSTGPDLIRWAEFHNMEYDEEPSLFHHFKVLRCDMTPLSEDEIRAFSECQAGVFEKPPGVEARVFTPEVGLAHGRALRALHNS